MTDFGGLFGGMVLAEGNEMDGLMVCVTKKTPT